MIVEYSKSAGHRPRPLRLKQSFRSETETWFGPLWLATVVAQQLVLDGALEANVVEGTGGGSSRVLGVEMRDQPIIRFEASSKLGRRIAKRVV